MASTDPVRILVVDDSAVVRSVLKEFLGSAPGLEVVGVAHNGRQGLAMVESLQPDAVVLDVQMPKMNGTEFLEGLPPRERDDLVVVVFTSASKDNAEMTMECLSLGADEVVAKPDPGRTGLREPLEAAVEDLTETILGLIRARDQGTAAADEVAAETPSAEAGVLESFHPDLVVIGSSTGGRQTLDAILGAMPQEGSVRTPLLMVHHIAQGFTAPLTESLTARSPFPWRQAADGEKVPLGTGLVAPGDFHLGLARRGNRLTVELDQAPRVNSCRPAVDYLFQSAAALRGTNILAIVLTGMGQDGLAGARAIRDQGGMVVVQDAASSTIWGMPGAVVGKDLQHAILTPDGIAGILAGALYARTAG
ncbi:chemotaxis-specific protein-glutamate methyltransferase CheB [Thiohalorhabdus sp.]|uniref:chemotaxis-specific protein-glutamate methyltransferase CheB n=1 Tax=Thiohalorhabdus sp. TaxID=3094134 RepID=UPI002FC3BE7E